MRISVTAKHIKLGTKHIDDGRLCPIALALTDAGVPVSTVYWSGHVDLRTVTVPAEALAKIRKLQSGKRIRPFKFELA